MPLFRTLVSLTLAFTITGCGRSSTEPGGNFRIRVFNGSTRVITNLKVMTGPDNEFTITKLSGGDMSGEYRVRELHVNPLVSLTVDGRELVSHPIEGFTEGFNRSLPEGSYTIDIEFVGNPSQLIVTVNQPVEDKLSGSLHP